MINPLTSQSDLNKYISDILDARITVIVERRLKEGLLTELKEILLKDQELRFSKLEALNRIVEDLKILFGK